jgi:3',5'-cyclic AMP phosphodiesterase CpdA
MTNTTTIAHLTDVHLGPIAGFTPRYWNPKRMAGHVNWLRNRRHAYRRDVLDRIVADMRAQAPDHIAVTGDLANIGLPQEHINALAWLETLGPPDRVTVVPGNHDIYSRIGNDAGTRRWAPYMRSDAQGGAFVDGRAEFPFVRVVGNVALVGVNSAVPSPLLMAWGIVGNEQLARLSATLQNLAHAQLFRLVLIHHPPLAGQASWARGLRDADALERALSEHGAELVIHGHNHRNMLAWRQAPAGPFPIVGAPSSSLGHTHKHEALARYNLYRIGPGARTVTMIGRGLAAPDDPIGELERRTLLPMPQPRA